jgi:hypothetical protein
MVIPTTMEYDFPPSWHICTLAERGESMNKKIALLVVSASLGLTVVGFPKVTMAGPPTPSASQILVAQTFEFQLQGDGISTHFAVTPKNLVTASDVAYLPFPSLPLVGVAQESQNSSCTDGQNRYSGTFSIHDRKLVVDFSTAVQNGDVVTCDEVLVYKPE